MDLWISISIFVVTFALIVSEKIERSIAGMLGAGAVILLHLIPYETALEKVDLDVVFLLMGMMMIVGVLAVTGFFEWGAIWVARKAHGRGAPILVMLLLLTALLSALLDNVTTVVLIAPITILITQILELSPAPFLILEAVFSNLGGTATLIGDPPNILIGSRGNLSFLDFLVSLAPIVFVIVAASLVLAGLFLGKRLQVKESVRARIMKAEPRLAILDAQKMRRALVIFGLTLAGFVFHHWIEVQPGIIAVSGAFFMCMVCRVDIQQALEKVEWNTIFFIISLFMLVGALEENGLFTILGEKLLELTRGNLALTAIAVIWSVGILSALMGNLPFVIASITLIQSMIPLFAVQMGLDGQPELIRTQIAEPLYWSLALGACLGGNGTIVGAAANVVIVQIGRRNNVPITFGSFFRVSAPLTILSLVLASGYVYLRYFVF